MDLRLLLLSLTTFAAGVAESVLIGILPPLASDLRVSVSLAGQLTALFSVAFAVAVPLVTWLTRRWERRRLLVAALLVFALFNVFAALSPNYSSLLLARIGMAACCGLLIVISTLLASELARPGQQGRAIGIIFMGISASLVFGVPMGVRISSWFGWRWIFFGIAVYSLPLSLLLWRYLPDSRSSTLPGRAGYLRQLSHRPLWLAQAVSILLLGGHFTLFTYFTPYLATMLGMTDVSAAFCLALASIPLSLHSVFFIPSVMLWSTISWMISPVVQSFLLHSDPASGSAGVALNTSAMHLGGGLGAAIGGLVIALADVGWTPWTGLGLTVLALLCAVGAATHSNSPAQGSTKVLMPVCDSRTGSP